MIHHAVEVCPGRYSADTTTIANGSSVLAPDTSLLRPESRLVRRPDEDVSGSYWLGRPELKVAVTNQVARHSTFSLTDR